MNPSCHSMVLWSTLAFALCACTDDGREGNPPETISYAAFPVEGGYADSTTKAAVGIHRVQNGQVIAACTGTLIAPNLVLTARHCVASINGDASQCNSGATFGTTWPASQMRVFNDQTFSYQTHYHPVSQVIVPSENRTCGRDVALLILSESFTASAATPIEPRVGEQAHFNETYSAVGYGNTCGTCSDGGLARYRRDNLDVACVGSCGYPAYAGSEEFWGGDGVCSGDSGGPALDAQGRVIGVASRAGVDGGHCVQSIYERVDAQCQLIKNTAVQAASAGGYTAPAWANGACTSSQTCDDCMNGSVTGGVCTSAYDACANDADCTAFMQCTQGCTTDACYAGCYQSHPAGEKLYAAIITCACDTACPQVCATQCATAQCGFTINGAACNSCFTQKCCSQGYACADDPVCNALVVCMSTCTTQACINSCRSGYQAGTALYDALDTCLGTDCAADCGGGGTGGTGGAGGTGGSAGTGGTGGSAGTGATGGSAGAGGAIGGSGGQDTGGSGGRDTGGTAGVGGDPGSGGTPGTGGAVPPDAGNQPAEDLSVEEGAGCGCRTRSSSSLPGNMLTGAAAAVAIALIRRRRRR